MHDLMRVKVFADRCKLYGRCLPKAASIFEAGISDVPTCLNYPRGHHARIRTSNKHAGAALSGGQERRMRVVFPREKRGDFSGGDSFKE